MLNRVFLIGSTQPSTSGGSATYTIPATIIRHRDDDASDRYTNSMVTSDSDGLIRFHATQGIYDTLIQDGNQGNQGYIADLPVGTVEGVSTVLWAVFGATVTMNAALGVTGTITANTVTVNQALGVTGWATFGSTVTMNSTLGVTGAATLSGWVTCGSSVTMSGALGVTGSATLSGWATFGQTATFNGAAGFTGWTTFGASVTMAGAVGITGTLTVGVTSTFVDIRLRRIRGNQGTALVIGDFIVGVSWGSTATVSVGSGSRDIHGSATVTAGGSGIGANPTLILGFKDGAFVTQFPHAVVSRIESSAPTTGFWISESNATGSSMTFTFIGLPVAGSNYGLNWIVIGS